MKKSALPLYKTQISNLVHITRFWNNFVSSTNKIDRHDVTEILLKVALNNPNLSSGTLIVKQLGSEII
jgi:hypothetical protein